MREHKNGYIWREREWKKRLGISTAGIAVFFLIMVCFRGIILSWYALGFFLTALLINGVWQHLAYRREYRRYLAISDYLEAFESGNYELQGMKAPLQAGIQEGIHSQVLEQLERIGRAVEVYKTRLIEEKENTKSMITDISHQLKTPAAALGLCIELLDDEQTTQEEKEEFLERGKLEVQKLSHLMGTLMNLSRLEADMIRLNPKETSLKETLVRAVNGVYLKAEEKKMEIELEEFKDVILPHDPRWTAEAVSNVLDNAVKYSPEGTIIRIRVETLISYVFIEVEDEGIGIGKADYQKVFQRFYRGERPEVEAQEGAGVGLYLVRKIFEEQGGSVCIVPAYKKGTLVRLMLPKKYTIQ